MTKKTTPPLIQLPHDVSLEIRALVDRQEHMAQLYRQLLLDAEATGTIDRALLRDCLATYGQIRREILAALGDDPDSEDIMPVPVELHDS